MWRRSPFFGEFRIFLRCFYVTVALGITELSVPPATVKSFLWMVDGSMLVLVVVEGCLPPALMEGLRFGVVLPLLPADG